MVLALHMQCHCKAPSGTVLHCRHCGHRGLPLFRHTVQWKAFRFKLCKMMQWVLRPAVPHGAGVPLQAGLFTGCRFRRGPKVLKLKCSTKVSVGAGYHDMAFLLHSPPKGQKRAPARHDSRSTALVSLPKDLQSCTRGFFHLGLSV